MSSKQDYVLIAIAINEASLNAKRIHAQNPSAAVAANIALHDAACRMCEAFRKENPAFKKSIFLTACGFGNKPA